MLDLPSVFVIGVIVEFLPKETYYLIKYLLACKYQLYTKYSRVMYVLYIYLRVYLVGDCKLQR